MQRRTGKVDGEAWLHETGQASASPGVICRRNVDHRKIHAFLGTLEHLSFDGDPGDVVNG